MYVDDDSPMVSETEIRERVQREREALEAEHAARQQELDEASVQPDKEMEEEVRGEPSSLVSTPTQLMNL